MNRVLSLAAALLAAACASAPRTTFAQSAAERGQALDEVIAFRADQIRDRLQVDACSVYAALGRTENFRALLNPRTRARLTDADAARCREWAAAPRYDNGWYVRSMTLTGAGELTVTASANGHGGHRETFILRHGYGDALRWRVMEVRMTDFWYE
jgi:hypothetical protein